jgi:hypothetical protein
MQKINHNKVKISDQEIRLYQFKYNLELANEGKARGKAGVYQGGA